ncbi:DEAD/DEAH box helicase [Acidihalobacter aeolianus]|uniref:DEAD/DEAH box helicase n=1 Tax=Acidihalobacter aeolianus TaxID=2792603 RepID=UPI0012EA8E58|nr:DEAD/DEAH box helicase [Acidihalobacter aeolianus]
MRGDEQVIDDKLLKKAIYAIDELRWKKDIFSRRLATLLIALTWEHSSSKQRESLSDFFIVSLSRLGIAPSTGMIDHDFAITGQYRPTNSFLTELQIAALQSSNEIRISSSIFLLTEFQLGVLNAIERHRLVGISAPTSAGKSFAIYLTIIRHLQQSTASVIYVVPTLSLVSQVSRDLRELTRKTETDHVRIFTTYHPTDEKSIFVLTQERAMGAIDGSSLPEKGFLVVDEVQNLERVAQDSDQRAKILFDLLKELKDSGRLEKIVLSGPRLSNIGNVGFEIFGEPSDEQESQLAPVVNITYAIEQHKGRYWLNQYVDTLEAPNSISITEQGRIAGYGQSLYTDQFLDYLAYLVSSLGPKSHNIIFSPTAAQARNTARALAAKLVIDDVDERTISLAEYLKETVHPSYKLAETVKMGVGYHSGRVPMHARAAIEDAFRLGVIKDLVCTTSLMQGVNLPATTVIVRNPNLFIKRSKYGAAKLSPYEFANLRGRAGRLLKDFVGRSVVLDASAFVEEDTQDDLFKDEYKDLSPGYHEAFDQHRREVVENLDHPEPASGGPHKFLVIYIRQTLLRLGLPGTNRLREVGILLSNDEISNTLNALNNLKIPKAKALSHRYWDPFDLDIIYRLSEHNNLPSLPSSVWDRDVAKTLHDIIEFHADQLNYYYQRYIGESTEDRFVWAMCLSVEKWAREVSLRDILDQRHFIENIDDKIDEQITLLMNKVVYGIPSLLKPYADILNQGAPMLASIEWGSFHPVTRHLLEKGVPRDTAISARKNLLYDLNGDENDLDELVANRLTTGIMNLGYWERRQLSEAMD